MTAALVTIKVKAGENLMKRIRKVCQDLDVLPANFIEFAIENELQRQESQTLREDITLEEIRQGILGPGQTMHIHTEDEGPSVCELCLTPLETPKQVQGPLLCDNCLELAKGPVLEKADSDL